MKVKLIPESCSKELIEDQALRQRKGRNGSGADRIPGIDSNILPRVLCRRQHGKEDPGLLPQNRAARSRNRRSGGSLRI